jgi:cytochrome c-type biogenesis protein CcmH/NrfG
METRKQVLRVSEGLLQASQAADASRRIEIALEQMGGIGRTMAEKVAAAGDWLSDSLQKRLDYVVRTRAALGDGSVALEQSEFDRLLVEIERLTRDMERISEIVQRQRAAKREEQLRMTEMARRQARKLFMLRILMAVLVVIVGLLMLGILPAVASYTHKFYPANIASNAANPNAVSADAVTIHANP